MSLLIKHLENILGINIEDEALFKRAFMHKSYVNEQ